MKEKILIIVLAVVMVIGVPMITSAQSFGSMNQDKIQTQLQEHKQTEINLQEQDQERLQLRTRLNITSSAAIQKQERLQTQDQTKACFSDIEEHWAKEQIRESYNYRIVNGYPDGSFNPDRTITGPEGVVMMTKFMNNLAGIDTGDITPGAIEWDEMPEWAKAQLQEQNALRIMSQTNDYDNPQLNRLQFCIMLAKALEIEPSQVPEETVTFLDQELISQAELGYIHRLRIMGVVEGYEGNFNPERQVTRAEATSMLIRILNIIE